MGRKRSLEASQKADKAVKLRSQGKTYEEIAQALGYHDKSAAHKAVQKALQRHESESVSELRILQQLAYDDMYRQLWAMLKDEKGKLDLKVVDRLLKLLDQEARLHGLYTFAVCPNCNPIGKGGSANVILVEVPIANQQN